MIPPFLKLLYLHKLSKKLLICAQSSDRLPEQLLKSIFEFFAISGAPYFLPNHFQFYKFKNKTRKLSRRDNQRSENDEKTPKIWQRFPKNADAGRVAKLILELVKFWPIIRKFSIKNWTWGQGQTASPQKLSLTDKPITVSIFAFVVMITPVQIRSSLNHTIKNWGWLLNARRILLTQILIYFKWKHIKIIEWVQVIQVMVFASIFFWCRSAFIQIYSSKN